MPEIKNKPGEDDPLPWALRGRWLIDSANGEEVLSIDGLEHPATRAYVVHAVNAYPRLVALLRATNFASDLAWLGDVKALVGDEARALLLELGEDVED